MALEKIVSGGQTGADQAALDWALTHGIAHGGWCPKGRKAENGRIDDRYRLQETLTEDYAERTEWNVRDSDGTVILSIGSKLSGGSKETVRFAQELHKPLLHISREGTPEPARALVEFVREHRIRVLNVAGPRASEVPGIAEFTAQVLNCLTPELDHSRISASMFHKHAKTYQEKFTDQSIYEESFRKFCELLPKGKARVLDVACGPGNVARALRTIRPEIDLLCVDLAPGMVQLARQAVPNATFAVHDLRSIGELGEGFQGVICAFGLPYISQPEAAAFLRAAGRALSPGGAIYISTMLGQREDSGWHKSSTGNDVHITYYTEGEVLRLVEHAGFEIVWKTRMQSPSAASKKTTDLIVIGANRLEHS